MRVWLCRTVDVGVWVWFFYFYFYIVIDSARCGNVVLCIRSDTFHSRRSSSSSQQQQRSHGHIMIMGTHGNFCCCFCLSLASYRMDGWWYRRRVQYVMMMHGIVFRSHPSFDYCSLLVDHYADAMMNVCMCVYMCVMERTCGPRHDKWKKFNPSDETNQLNTNT